MDGSLSCQISSHNSHSRSDDHFLTSTDSIQGVRDLHLASTLSCDTGTLHRCTHIVCVCVLYIGTQVVHIANFSNGVYIIVLYYTHIHTIRVVEPSDCFGFIFSHRLNSRILMYFKRKSRSMTETRRLPSFHPPLAILN